MPLERIETGKRTDHRQLLEHHALVGARAMSHEEMVFWYGAVVKGRAGAQPRVLVWMRRIENDELSSMVRSIRVPLAELGHFPIGSIWQNGRSASSIRLEEATFSVDFSQGGWQCSRWTSFDLKRTGPQWDYPPLHLLKGDRSIVLTFKATHGVDDVELVIPCLEFFTRMYGSSSHVRRVLCTYPWDIGRRELLRPLPEITPAGKWLIHLDRRTAKGDAVLLAHLQYDTYALQQAKRIWGQLEASASSTGSEGCFLEVRPWMRGPGILKVRGVWLNEGRSFLAFRITGSSEPAGQPIECARDDASAVAASGAMTKGASGPRVRPKLKRLPKIVVDDNAMPQLGTSRVDVEDDEMQVLGELRAVVEVKRGKGEKSSATRPNPGSATSFSSEEPRSAKTGVGSATFVAEHQPEHLGVLREVWSLLLELRRTHPSFVLSVEQMTGQGQFIEGLHPTPVLFPPFRPEEIKDRRPKNIGWPYLDPGDGTLRGALVARVRTRDGDVYFLEMQRRLLTPKQKEADEKEESFKGLAFTARDASAAFEWVSSVMREVRFRQGKRLDKLVAPPGGVAHAWVHRSSKDPNKSQALAVRRAFDLVGLSLPG